MVCVLGTNALAASVRARVTYVAKAVVYVDAGRAQGLARGDSAVVWRGDKAVASIQISFLADSTASCRLLDSLAEVRVGDVAVFEITLPAAESHRDSLPSSYGSPSPSEGVIKTPRRAAANQLTGHIALQLYGQSSDNDLEYGFWQPALLVRVRVDRVLQSALTLNVRLRAERNVRSREAGELRTEWSNRFYEMALAYKSAESLFEWQAGRQVLSSLGAAGYLDGVVGSYRLPENVRAGIWGGTEPNRRTSRLQSDIRKAGIFASHEIQRATWRTRTTLAFAGQYRSGTVDREFLCEQVELIGSKLSFLESAEMDIHRGWRRERAGTSVDLSSVLAHARYAVSRAVSVSASVDNRKPMRTYETQSVADSLFDDALRQGVSAGMTARLPWRLTADLRAGLRTRAGDTDSRNGTAGLAAHDLAHSGLELSVRASAFDGRLQHGAQWTLTAARFVVPALRAGVQVGETSYALESGSIADESRWLRPTIDWTVARRWTISAESEFNFGRATDATRYFLQVGYHL